MVGTLYYDGNYQNTNCEKSKFVLDFPQNMYQIYSKMKYDTST